MFSQNREYLFCIRATISPMIRLIALDLDGTLLDSDKNFPEGFPAWVKSHPDINVCLASGRQLYTLMQQFSEIADRLWYIAENGAVIAHAGEIIKVDAMKTEDVMEILDEFPGDAVCEPLEIEKQLPALIREEIARASIDNNGKIIVTDDIKTAIDIANEIAPEHLELVVDEPFSYLDSIRHAGSIFMGRNCPEALGDYFAGPNHTLPTSGTARFSSPLSVDDFIKKTQYTYYTHDALKRVADDIAYFATLEGLTGHAKSAVIRTEDEK